MITGRFISHLFAAVLLAGPALAAPLEDAWHQCVISDRPHTERVAALKGSGWQLMDEEAARYSSQGMFFFGGADGGFDNKQLWAAPLDTFTASLRSATAVETYIVRTNDTPQNAHLRKHDAVLLMNWYVKDSGDRETSCGYAQPQVADVAPLQGSLNLPLDTRIFDIGAFSEMFARTFTSSDEWVGTYRVMLSKPDLPFIRTIDPSFPEIGFTFSSFVGIWDAPND